jgi:AbrB family looped-hinge helix DNA binding protein
MNLARLTTKGQMTIPKRVRESANLREGDLVSLDVENGVVTMRKLAPATDPYLAGVEETLVEWNSPEDNELWRDL